MKKKYIRVFEYANDIMNAVQKGVLVTTKTDDKVNAMSISWGMLGIEWNKEIFITFIREHRFTASQLATCPEFTVNIPYGSYDKKIITQCGTKSGYTTDKIQEFGLTPVQADIVSAPAIKELPLTLECRVIYKQKQDPIEISEELKAQCYPHDVDGSYFGANRDYHTAYYGEILKAYILE